MRLDCARLTLVALIFLSFFALPGCLVRRRTIAPAGKHETRPVLSANRQDLIERIHSVYDPIQSFSLKVDMSPSIGDIFGGQVTDYATIAGIVLFKKPENIRVIGLDPVIHSTAFDMVSVGNDFRVSIPSKNQFFIGHNDSPANSKNKLENMRPAAFLGAMIIDPPDPKTDIILEEDDTNETMAAYILSILRHNGDNYYFNRKIYFDRYSLQIARQKTFDMNGDIKSDIHYSNWALHNSILFPGTIEIQRPMEGYEVLITVTDIKLNTGDITAEKFVLNQPPTATVKQIQ